jgi:hypothetical protein
VGWAMGTMERILVGCDDVSCCALSLSFLNQSLTMPGLLVSKQQSSPKKRHSCLFQLWGDLIPPFCRTTATYEWIWSWIAEICKAMSIRLSFRASDSFWNWLIDISSPVDPVPILVRRPSPTMKRVRQISFCMYKADNGYRNNFWVGSV